MAILKNTKATSQNTRINTGIRIGKKVKAGTTRVQVKIKRSTAAVRKIKTDTVLITSHQVKIRIEGTTMTSTGTNRGMKRNRLRKTKTGSIRAPKIKTGSTRAPKIRKIGIRNVTGTKTRIGTRTGIGTAHRRTSTVVPKTSIVIRKGKETSRITPVPKIRTGKIRKRNHHQRKTLKVSDIYWFCLSNMSFLLNVQNYVSDTSKYILGDAENQKDKVKEEKSDIDSAREDSVDEDDQKLVIKEEPDSQDEIEKDYVNISAASSCDYNLSQFKDEPDFSANEEDEKPQVKDEQYDSEEDVPLVSKGIILYIMRNPSTIIDLGCTERYK